MAESDLKRKSRTARGPFVGTVCRLIDERPQFVDKPMALPLWQADQDGAAIECALPGGKSWPGPG
jgi:hypothetical protein